MEYVDHMELCILRYSRPFAYTTTPTGKKKTRLPADFAKLVGMNQELHDRMLNARNSVVAHSDMSQKSIRLCVAPTSDPAGTAYGCDSTWTILGSRDIESFHATGERAVKGLQDVVSSLLKLYGHELQRDQEGWLVLTPHPDD